MGILILMMDPKSHLYPKRHRRTNNLNNVGGITHLVKVGEGGIIIEITTEVDVGVKMHNRYNIIKINVMIVYVMRLVLTPPSTKKGKHSIVNYNNLRRTRRRNSKN